MKKSLIEKILSAINVWNETLSLATFEHVRLDEVEKSVYVYGLPRVTDILTENKTWHEIDLAENQIFHTTAF